MSYQTDRDRCLVALAQAGFSLEQSHALLRLGTTLHRLAEAQCNGDWPFDNGVRETVPCPRCQTQVIEPALHKRRLFPEQGKRSVTVRLCPDCRAQDQVRVIVTDGPKMCHKGHNFHVETDPVTHTRLCCTKAAWQPYFQGDPRGCVLMLYPAGTSHEDMYCARPTEPRAIAVPGRY